jgi:predicted ribosomally synthesized peptide with SipW-like signal peptide
MRIKLASIVVSVILAAILVGGYTMAWFTDSDKTGPQTFTAGTLLIEAGVINSDPQDLDDRWKLVDILPEEVVYFAQGTRPTREPVKSGRGDPNAVLKLDDKFFSLGFYMEEDESIDVSKPNPEAWKGRGGEIIVKFNEQIIPKGKCLVLAVEETWSGWPEEKAKVYVGQYYNGGNPDNYAWVYVGTADNGEYPRKLNELDLPDNTEWFQYVRVVDVTDPCGSDYEKSIWNRDDNDAFDLNAVMVRNMELVRWNPGDKDKIGYYVRNIGTKSAYVRATFAGEWQQFDEESGKWVPFSEGDPDLVSLNIHDDSAGLWTEMYDQNGKKYFVYNGDNGKLESGQTAKLYLWIELDGPGTGNEYQDKRFVLSGKFDGVQTTHGARDEVWGSMNPLQ